MRRFLTLLKREFLEWKTVFIVVMGIYVVFLGLLAYGSFRTSQELQKHGFSVTRQGEEVILQFGKNQRNSFRLQIEEDRQQVSGSGGRDQLSQHSDSDEEHSSRAENYEQGVSDTEDTEEGIIVFGEESDDILAIWGHFLRGMLVTINILVMILAVFYLTDSVFKERSDSSTFYYRSLPVSDGTLLMSKFIFGTIGILFFAFLLSTILALYVHLIIPSEANMILLARGTSLSQIQYGDLLADWASYHLLQFVWLSPLAAYFMLVSTVVKNRPFLTSIGILVLLALLWKYLFGQFGVANQITVNFSIFGEVIEKEWLQVPGEINSETEIELFGSFHPYIASLRTVASLIVAGIFGWATHYLYRRNIEVS